jgi:LPXTG-site transpeptidase (sortase) family protein
LPLRVLPDLTLPDLLVIALGLLAGIGVLFLIRSRQVWRYRRGLGYTVYDADRLRRNLARWAVMALLLVIGVAGVYVWQVAFQGPALFGPIIAAQTEATPVPAIRLLIPRLGVEAPMIEAPIVARRWDISLLTDEVAHLAGTAYPGDPGNAVLAGHVTIPDAGWGPFKDLETLQPGDHLFVERQGQTFVYEVVGGEVVAADAVEVTFPTEGYRLTLITCTGWDDDTVTYAQRIVIYAELIAEP